MNDIAIKVQNLSKQYNIWQNSDLVGKEKGHQSKLRSIFRERKRDSILLALDEVNFQVEKGTALAVIGRNGAGKSTLLKILSRVTEPTRGRAELNGRIGALLEVGTGFHPELTGRENVFLSGAILGMKRIEINQCFDEIVAFSGVEKYLDMPIKYYSSGMRVRLGFAVAAHLNPEVLLIDEVLAVGDSEFQKKCLGKMNSVTKQGRTILFVSHNMGAVQALCTRGIFLQNGKIAVDGTVGEAVTYYLQTIENQASFQLEERTDRTGLGKVRLLDIEIVNSIDPHSRPVITGEPVRFEFQLSEHLESLNFEYLDFAIYDLNGYAIAYFNSSERSSRDVINNEIGTKMICEIDQLVLSPGRYRINAGIKGDGEIQDHIEGAVYFNVEDGNNDNPRVLSREQRPGHITLNHRWIVPK